MYNRDMSTERAPRIDHEPARQFALTFISQWHSYPLQLPDGSYVRIKQPLTPHLIDQHLRGEITLGAYALDEGSQASWIALDADDNEMQRRLATAYSRLAGSGIPAYLELSRRGGHLWLFIEQVSGATARQFGRGIIRTFNLDGIELYPKQDVLKTGPGSLVRLPFGIHRLTGKRYHFITPDRQPLAPTIRQQLAILAQPKRVSPTTFAEYVAHGPATGQRPQPDIPSLPSSNIVGETVSERLKARITVKAFVSQYVDLNAQNRGYCPFHDDSRMSFGVNDDKNFWHCFAGCGGGSIIDFWQRWRELHGQDDSFAATVKDLAAILL